MNLKKAFKIGCLGALGLGALFLLASVIWYSNLGPKERARVDAEHEAKKRKEIAEEKAEKAKEDSAQKETTPNVEEDKRDQYSCDASGFQKFCSAYHCQEKSNFQKAHIIRTMDYAVKTEPFLYNKLFEMIIDAHASFPCLKRIRVSVYCKDLESYYHVEVDKNTASTLATPYPLDGLKVSEKTYKEYMKYHTYSVMKQKIKPYTKLGV